MKYTLTAWLPRTEEEVKAKKELTFVDVTIEPFSKKDEGKQYAKMTVTPPGVTVEPVAVPVTVQATTVLLFEFKDFLKILAAEGIET